MSTSIEKTITLHSGINIADRTSRRNLYNHRIGFAAESSQFIDGKLNAAASITVPLFTKVLMIFTGDKNLQVTIVRSGSPGSTVTSKINGVFILTDATNITSITLTNSLAAPVPPAIVLPESYRIIIA